MSDSRILTISRVPPSLLLVVFFHSVIKKDIVITDMNNRYFLNEIFKLPAVGN